MIMLTALATQAQRTLTGTVTDINGHYSIKIDGENAVLVFRYVGMEPYQVAVKNMLAIDVKMKEQTAQLAETVVVSTGYQRLSRERSTAAFGFVDSTKLNRIMHRDVISALEGQVAGLRMDINPNTGEANPVLRGIA